MTSSAARSSRRSTRPKHVSTHEGRPAGASRNRPSPRQRTRNSAATERSAVPTTTDQPRVEVELRTPICPTCVCSLSRLGVRREDAARGRHEGNEYLFERRGSDCVYLAPLDREGSNRRSTIKLRGPAN